MVSNNKALRWSEMPQSCEFYLKACDYPDRTKSDRAMLRSGSLGVRTFGSHRCRRALDVKCSCRTSEGSLLARESRGRNASTQKKIPGVYSSNRWSFSSAVRTFQFRMPGSISFTTAKDVAEIFTVNVDSEEKILVNRGRFIFVRDESLLRLIVAPASC